MFNNKILCFLNAITNLMILNLLWFLCCIPVVTIVPSTAAMYYVTLKMVKKEDPYIIRSFLHSFRENFKQGIVLSIFFIVLAGILFVDIWILHSFSSDFHQILMVISCLFCVLVMMTLAYVCPFLSRFQNTVAVTLKNAFIIGLSNPVKSVIILTIDLLPVLLLIFFPDVFAVSIIFWLVLGFAVIALLNSILLSKLFAKYEPKEIADVDNGVDQIEMCQ